MKRAAVVIPLVAGADPFILFVRRAAHLRRNAGQIGFPGGLVDAADRGDMRHTALRELEEELGLDAEGIVLVHRLPEAVVVNRTVQVTPFVGVVAERPVLKIDAHEVDEVLEIPLARIVEPGALHEGIEHFAGLDIPTWQFDYKRIHIWGATARILHGFLEAVAENARLRAELAVLGITLSP